MVSINFKILLVTLQPHFVIKAFAFLWYKVIHSVHWMKQYICDTGTLAKKLMFFLTEMNLHDCMASCSITELWDVFVHLWKMLIKD